MINLLMLSKQSICILDVATVDYIMAERERESERERVRERE